MKMKYLFVGLLLVLPLGQNNIYAQNTLDTYQPVKPADFPIPQFPELLSQDINIVFAGFEDFTFDLTYLESIIPQSHAPINRYASYYSPDYVYYNNYTLNYNFEFLDGLFLQDFRDFLYSNGKTDIAPWMLQPDVEFAEYIESEIVEGYLNDTVMTDKTPTLIILDTYSFDPSGHLPYFYNATTFDYDVDSVPRSYGSSYQIAGGGHNSRLLWLDLSAGPTYYRGGVTEDTVPPVWNYDPIINNTDFHDNLGSYIKSSVELRMLPSYIYTPVHALEEVKFEIKLVNLDASGFDYLSVFDPKKLISTYSETNPYVDWTYSISEWNYQSDSSFTDTLNLAFNSTTNDYDGYRILDYLDQVYQNQFTESTDNVTIIPIYLFAFPDDQLFQQFLGIANNIGGEFSYLVAALNHQYADIALDLVFDNWLEVSNRQIDAGFYDSVWGTVGSNEEVYETTINVNSGSLDFYLLDAYNFQQFQGGSSFTYEETEPGVTGSISFNHSVNLWKDYYWVFKNTGGSPVNFDTSVNKYSKRSFGFTFVVIHEVGHALGLSHPHDGFSWTNGEYLDWLWDLSYTPMTYAHHHSDLSIFDIDTLRRGAFPIYVSDLIAKTKSFVDEVETTHTYFPELIFEDLVTLTKHLFDAINLFKMYTELDDDISHFEHLFLGYDILDQLKVELVESSFSHSINILNLPAEGNYSLILEYPGFYQKVDLTPQINLQDLPWTDIVINIYLDGELVFSFSGYTWELPTEITLNIDELISSSITSIPLSSEETEDSLVSDPVGFISFYHSPILFFVILVLQILKKRKI